ncbi:methyltransferase domain-containing protein [Novispirillum sp. DQ9]|uniref:class I SAM-dependent methyltransferase n=1 Tax=Novispirillum sp. DQ9 TaxID=3398612 RepID=UPI003C7D93D9
MNVHDLDMRVAAAKHIRWLPASITITDDVVAVEGWALSLWDDPAQGRFTLNGQDFDEVEWPLPSSYLRDHFDGLPHAEMSHFRCRHRTRPGETVFPGGFARFNAVGQFGEHRRSYRTAWFVADPKIEPPLPSQAQIARVIGSGDVTAFQWGGATIINRIEHFLRDRFDRSLASFDAVLDWGCGAGRLSRYLPKFTATLPGALTGADIDADNVRNCRETIPEGTFHVVDLMPPTPFADGQFDLVIGLSVLTHMNAQVQDAWLPELRRITRPGALVLLSVQGLAQSALYRTPADILLETHRLGLNCRGVNGQLAGFIPDDDYYKDTLYSPDYIYSHWGRHFDVLEIVEAMAGNQDLVVLRRRAD